jgi:Tol biopolymer transport system component
MNHHKAFIAAGIVTAGCFFFAGARAQPGAEVFNLGRTRCFTGGFSLTADDKTIFTTQTFKKDAQSSLRLKIFTSTWSKNQWSPLAMLSLNDYHEIGPVISPDGSRLYFSSTSPAPGKAEEGDVNIWYTEKEGGNWSKPIFAEGLNTDQGDRISFIDKAGTIYLVSSRGGNLDAYTSESVDGQFTTPVAVAEWNTDLDEEYVSVNSSSDMAFLQRSKQGETTEILWSTLTNGRWSTPAPLRYEGKFTQMPYVQKWPRLSNDQSTFFLIGHGLIYQFPYKEIAASNSFGIAAQKVVMSFKPLKIAPRKPSEPEPFGGLTLKTNNGISFTADGKTVYLSRYTVQRDTFGGQFIKIFESRAGKSGWSEPRQVPFMNEKTPYEYHPVLAPDGKKLFYNSRAAKPGAGVEYYSKNNVWHVERLGNGNFGTPDMIDVLATDEYDDYASVAKSGTLYFRSDRPGGKGSGDIYRSQYVEGKYQAPENLVDLNSVDNENDVCIDPNEKFIIFNRYIDATKEIKLFLSIRSGGVWSTPRTIDALEKETDWELTPTLSPDGKFFFYEVNSNILRVPVAELLTPDEKRSIDKG